jgi:hypothetical protein
MEYCLRIHSATPLLRFPTSKILNRCSLGRTKCCFLFLFHIPSVVFAWPRDSGARDEAHAHHNLVCSQALGLPKKAEIGALVSKGKELCSTPWSQLRKTHPDLDASELATYCFGASYVYSVLHEGYHFPEVRIEA